MDPGVPRSIVFTEKSKEETKAKVKKCSIMKNSITTFTLINSTKLEVVDEAVDMNVQIFVHYPIVLPVKNEKP